MSARRRRRAKRRNLALARRAKTLRQNRPRPLPPRVRRGGEPPPALPVRRPAGAGALRRPPDDLDAHRPATDLLRRVHAHLADRFEI